MARPSFVDRLVAALLVADEAFDQSKDTLAALGAVALAAKSGVPIPPHIGAWLHGAISAYFSPSSDKSLDAELELKASGRGSPRRRRRDEQKMEADLLRMSMLVALGTTNDEAAQVVAVLGNYTAKTLLYRFRGRGKEAREARPHFQLAWSAAEIERLLQDEKYPTDRIAVRHALRGIKKRYPNLNL